MVTKEQAGIIGEAFVEHAQSQALERKNAAARRVLGMHRFPELKAFEPWERPIVVAEAAKRAMRKKSVVIAWLVSCAIVIAGAYAALALWKDMPMAWAYLAGAIAFAPFIFYRREVVRQYIRESARLRQSGVASAPNDASRAGR